MKQPPLFGSGWVWKKQFFVIYDRLSEKELLDYSKVPPVEQPEKVLYSIKPCAPKYLLSWYETASVSSYKYDDDSSYDDFYTSKNNVKSVTNPR